MITSPTSFRPTQKLRLGELMVQLGFLTQAQLDGTLSQQKSSGAFLGRVMVAKGLCSEPQVMAALSNQLGLPFVDLDSRELRCSGLLPHAFAKKHRAIAFERPGIGSDEVLVALTAPAKLDTQDAVRAVIGKSKLRFALASDAALDRALIRVYSPEAEAPVLQAPIIPEVAAEPAEIVARLDLSPRTQDVIRRAAAELSITPREVVRRAMESWASTRRAR